MEMAYRLAVEDSPMIQAIRKNVIVMITPTLEVDGRDTMVDLYNYRKANEGKRAPGLIYWGKYVAHDNNRDSMGMALALTRNQMSHVSRLSSDRSARPARIGALPLYIDRHRAVQRVA